MKNNIATIVYSHYSRDARVRRYAESLARKGFGVDVICLNEVYLPQEDNITLIKYPLPRRRSGRLWYILEYFLFYIYSFLILTLNHFSKKYRIIHINNMPDILVFTAIIPKLLGAKIILDMHDPMPELYMSKYHETEICLPVRLLKWLEELSFNFADSILTANDSFKSLFEQRHNIPDKKLSVILNCPDPLLFNNQSRRSGIFRHSRESSISSGHDAVDTHSSQTASGHFTLLYMGTVEKRFGLDIVLEAIPTLIKTVPNLKFVIIPKLENEGGYFNNFKLQITNYKLEEYIKILSPQPLENIAKYIKQADIGVVLAQNGVFTENIFPVKLLEFVQMGIPVIATKTKVLSTYFQDDQIYFLQKNTPEEFAKAVLNLYQDDKLKRDYTQRAKEYLKENNWINEEKKYLDITRHLIKQV